MEEPGIRLFEGLPSRPAPASAAKWTLAAPKRLVKIASPTALAVALNPHYFKKTLVREARRRKDLDMAGCFDVALFQPKFDALKPLEDLLRAGAIRGYDVRPFCPVGRGWGAEYHYGTVFAFKPGEQGADEIRDAVLEAEMAVAWTGLRVLG